MTDTFKQGSFFQAYRFYLTLLGLFAGYTLFQARDSLSKAIQTGDITGLDPLFITGFVILACLAFLMARRIKRSTAIHMEDQHMEIQENGKTNQYSYKDMENVRHSAFNILFMTLNRKATFSYHEKTISILTNELADEARFLEVLKEKLKAHRLEHEKQPEETDEPAETDKNEQASDLP